jgi:hypothetical protein
VNRDDRKPVTLADLDAAIERIGHKQPIVFESPSQTFQNPIGFTAEEIERARRDPSAFVDFIMRHDPRPAPPPGAASRTGWPTSA